MFTLVCVKVSVEMQKNRLFKADDLVFLKHFTGNFTAISICIPEHTAVCKPVQETLTRWIGEEC